MDKSSGSAGGGLRCCGFAGCWLDGARGCCSIALRDAEQETLHDAAAGGLEQRHLLACFHPLGGDIDAERASERHDGGDDRRYVRILGKLADEAAVDLDLVEREVGE